MRYKRRLAVLVGVLFGSLVLAAAIGAAPLQAPAIDWDVMGGGGGHLEQGSLSLDYTIGQPLANQLGSGDAALCVGYWCGVSTESRIYLPLVLKSA
jgi:hypothetical protein